MSAPNGDRRFRWFELGVSIVIACVSAAVSNAWILSGRLARIDMSIENIGARVDIAEGRLLAHDEQIQRNTSSIAVQDARWDEIQRWMEKIDRKLDQRDAQAQSGIGLLRGGDRKP